MMLYKASYIFSVIIEFKRLVEKSKESWLRKAKAEKRRSKMNTPIKTSRSHSATVARKADIETNGKTTTRESVLESIVRRQNSFSQMREET